MKSFAAMNVSKWKTIHHNYYFIMAWVSVAYVDDFKLTKWWK